MFDVTSEEIAELNDEDLRALIARLCEAELSMLGHSPSAVTWGGNQTAPDGGLDVRVSLPSGNAIDGFIPNAETGFQVKKPDMPRREIIREMRPADAIRPVIQELSNKGGAYIIVSSTGSTSDSALQRRRNALREALAGVVNADQLHTDFYDRARLATWVRRHPGLSTWVKEKIGRSMIGWRAYGAWCGGAEDENAEYLLDDKLRLHLGKHRDTPAQSVAQAIDEIRDDLAQPRKMVRLVGLSGVGKTRLVQALFDARIGNRPLPKSLAVYTNLSDNPNPQPLGLATDLIESRTRAILIVDNCPPDLHRRLSEICTVENSTLSVITVEYDIREDQPEGTQVVTLETSSPELIEKLVQRRFPHVSQIDARTIAEASGGNARIAMALAETVERSESIGGLSNEELFQRLFRQRHEPDNALLLAAQACSLVYSFQGESLEGDDAELPRLASLAGQDPVEIYRHVGELLRRDLVQHRGVWRAVLPHAIANRLAARALEDIPYNLINQQLVEGGTDRLARSFSRRLSFLHDHARSVDIVNGWLSVGGLLGNVAKLNDLGRAMFENVAPVTPEAALSALERVVNGNSELAVTVWYRHRNLLRSLAYDPALFDRSIELLARTAVNSPNEREARDTSDTFVSLFALYLSGTHATIEQRLSAIERLLRSNDTKSNSLGLAALDAVLEATHFSSSHSFEFGARSRDFGYRPLTIGDVKRWYCSALELIKRLAITEELLKPQLRTLLAKNFRGLWSSAHMLDEVEPLLRKFAADGFWREGWAACRQTMHFDKDRLAPEALARLSALEAELRPSNLEERVHALVLGDRTGGLDLEDMDIEKDVTSAVERLDSMARDLGTAVAVDDAVFEKLLPDLLRGGNRVWIFGRGLAAASTDRHGTWERLAQGLEQIPVEQRNVQIMRGFLAEVWEQEKELAQNLLDLALGNPTLISFLPVLETSVEIDEQGVDRLKQALTSHKAPIWMYRNLACGRATDTLPGRVLTDLLRLITAQPDGFDVALEILFMRLHSDNSAKREHDPALLEAGRELLQHIQFRKNGHRDNHMLAGVAKACLPGADAGHLAASVASRLKQAVANFETHSFDNTELLEALLKTQPNAVLDALFNGDEGSQREGFAVFDHIVEHRANPADVISCETLVSWCDQDSEKRYPVAASIVSFAKPSEENGPKVWSEQAIALLSAAPNPKDVLKVFIERFRPMSWSGSRAAIMEANAKLLDDLDTYVKPELMHGVPEAKTLLFQEIDRERRWETERDRSRDERFE